MYKRQEWDTAKERLNVTWDSSRTNSYFYHALPTILTKGDDFVLSFDLMLNEVVSGADPEKPSTFQLAIALMNFESAARPDFFRGSGINAEIGPRHFVEFDYFPASSDGFILATVSPTLISSNNQFAASFAYPLELTLDDWFHVEMTYTASDQTLATVILRNGEPFAPVPDTVLGSGFSDVRLDTVAVCSFSDEQQTPPEFAGSLFARGAVDNIRVTVPPPPIQDLTGAFSNGVWRVGFTSREHWIYTLECSGDLVTWTDVALPAAGNGGVLVLEDSAVRENSFYRVRAARP